MGNVWFYSGGFSYAMQVNSTLSFTWKTDIKFAIRAISVFRVKFNVEFTRQAVSFSIGYKLREH